MNCREFGTLLMDLVYDEIDPGAGAAAREHAAGCEACRARLEAVRGTRECLRTLDEPLPDVAFLALPGAGPTPARVAAFPPRRRRWAAVAAAVAVCLLAGLLVMKTSIRFSNGALEVRIGGGGPEDGASRQEDQLRRLADSIEENQIQKAYVVVNQMIAESEERQLQRTLDLIQNVYQQLEARKGASRGVQGEGVGFAPAAPASAGPLPVALREPDGPSRWEKHTGVTQ
jgi:hypothetical protein